tara:strand:+ start:711 stop:1187 length:477 start_codon:yes stop_codon:yes gene_type:complete
MSIRQTILDLNGPVLGFTSHPVSTTVTGINSAQFSGFATATFPVQIPANPSGNTGSISYQWYNSKYGALSDGTLQEATLTGTGTTILVIENAVSNELDQTEFYLTVDYIPSAYVQPSTSPVTVGTARSTPNAVNDNLTSNSGILTVNPTLSITQQPQE